MVGIGRAHFESVQAVRYTRGQYYRRHHDVARTVPLDRNRTKWLRAAPMRILTAFLYLTDVAAGGETRFTLGPGGQAETVAVQPAAGRLVLFKARTVMHEVLPTHRKRFALTLWYFDDGASAES